MGIVAREFGSLITAMVTGFDADGELDLGATVEVAKFLQASGNTALVVTGTTGEASTLTDSEKIALWEAVSHNVTIPVLAGAGSNDTPHSVHMTKAATQVGVAGILAVAPYYNRPPQSGILGHFEAVASATTLPVIVYDIPVRTGRKVAPETLYQLVARAPNVLALKDAAGNPAATAEICAQLGSKFDIYSGDDALTLPLLSIGASGVIGVATHWASRFFAAMMDSFAQGEVSRATAINAALFGSYNYETSESAPNPIPTKVMMRQLGFAVGQCRLPLGAPREGLELEAARVLAELKGAGEDLMIKADF